MKRLSRALLLMLLPLTSAAGAREAMQDPSAVPQDPKAPVDGTMLNLGEQTDQRLTVPVAVGARGPYNFIIDTGAERTVVSRELAGQLGLSPGEPVMLSSMTGRDQVNTVLVPGLAIESVGVRHDIVAPALESRNIGAPGLLGIDTLSNNMVVIDFESNTMTVRKSQDRRPRYARDPDEIVVMAKSMFGQLIVTEAHYGKTKIQVVLDTGSPVSIANTALRNKVKLKPDQVFPITMTSVVGAKMSIDYTMVPQLTVGGITFARLPLAFADVAPFKKFGLENKPAMMLGMDALRSFRRVEIDFPNKQVRFLMPRNDDVGMTLRPGGATRLPQFR